MLSLAQLECSTQSQYTETEPTFHGTYVMMQASGETEYPFLNICLFRSGIEPLTYQFQAESITIRGQGDWGQRMYYFFFLILILKNVRIQ